MDEMMVPGVQDQPRQPGNPGSRRQKPRAWRQASAEPSVKSTAIGELPCALSSTRRRDAACSGSSVARGTTLHYLSQQGIVSASRNSVETMEKGRRRVDRSTGTREGREEPRPLCPGETLNLSTGGRHIERAGEAENKRREEEVAQPIPRMLQSSTPTHGQVWGKDWKSHASPSPLQTDRAGPELLGPSFSAGRGWPWGRERSSFADGPGGPLGSFLQREDEKARCTRPADIISSPHCCAARTVENGSV